MATVGFGMRSMTGVDKEVLIDFDDTQRQARVRLSAESWDAKARKFETIIAAATPEIAN